MIQRFFRPHGKSLILGQTLLLFRPLRRLKLRRARLKTPRRLFAFAVPFPPLAFKRPIRPRIKRKRIGVLRHPMVLRSVQLLFRRLPKIKIKRRAVLLKPRRYAPAPPPANAVYRAIARPQRRRRLIGRFFRPRRPLLILALALALFRPLRRLKIKRARLRLRPRVFTPAALQLLFKPARRLKLRRRPAIVKARRYPQFAAPVHLIAFKKPPRAKVRRRRAFIRLARISSRLIRLLADPRFGSLLSYRPFASRLPYRSFASILGWPVPQGPDLGQMDVGETGNAWVDFSRWLPTGVTIASISSVSVSNYLPAGGAPYAQLAGAAAVGTAPPALGGSGVANMAVLNQVTGLAPGWYRFQAWIMTSDGQELTGWAHGQVSTPN